ncbi:AraC family transcriptional regulator [Mesorhizobium sp. VK23B]|uniref:AraC family transcriptional regulator n=1 Tax=Mesorhizobium dulcispinae TaxID=3072316 RepID=A0ABU4XFQ2_9HYPH|nr:MULTISPECIES: AraC family transcriptional regulator [unclassified Mesorhizobium]MDX8467405.1 AraC family transcriptional regulator [Mesorhizobium sp. VK23B]MDX8473607.1 AraC family transcriptional regulator [Mesorhizobium sp. VK23A]MDX8518481.1 AraC family transcriptional regulator [Mesorhizobium sp. VK23D]
MEHLYELRTLVEGHGQEGATETAVTGLTLYVETDPEVVAYVVHRPVLALILGGGKRTVLGGRVFDIGPGDYVAVSVDLPATGQVTKAPYSAVTLDLDLGMIAELISEPMAPAWGAAAGVEMNRAGPDLLDAMLRLVRLLDRQQDVAVLAPMIRREVFWRILQSPCGPMVRQIALADSRLSQVSRAVAWLRTNYAEPVRIERLADLAGMSPASFHRHFKAATAMSPVQYQKRIRLQTARAQLLARPGDVAGVGFSVGYESPSQFSREYARLFGAPPARDVANFHEARATAPGATN